MTGESRTLFAANAIAAENGQIQTGFQSAARATGFEMFAEVSVESIAQEAAQRALTLLAAKLTPGPDRFSCRVGR